MTNSITNTTNVDEQVHVDSSADVLGSLRDVVVTDGCDPCRTAEVSGWWAGSLPRDCTHCRDCHVTFPGSNRWGHCVRCHQTFSGVLAFDLHQRDDGDGEFAPDCMCTVLTPGTGETVVYDGTHQRKWAVSGSKTLVLESTAWGEYWAQDTDLSIVFDDRTTQFDAAPEVRAVLNTAVNAGVGP